MAYHLAVCVLSSLLTILSDLFQHEDKQKAMLEFARVCAAMQILGFSEAEIKVIWSVLSAIYHLGIAGAVKGIFFYYTCHNYFSYTQSDYRNTC